MRILIWSFIPPSDNSAYWNWFKAGMEAVGHQVITVDSFALTEVFGPRRMQEILLAYARAYRIQATVLMPQNFVEVDFLQALRRLGVAIVHFRYDDALIGAMGIAQQPRTLLENFTYTDDACDLSVTFCKAVVPMFEALGLPPVVYQPMPFPWQAIPAGELPHRPVIAYAGSPKYREKDRLSGRVVIACALIDAGLPVELHNDAWATVPGCETAALPSPSLAEFYDVFRTSTVNIGLASDWGERVYPMIKGIHLEIACAGGMQITTRATELDDYFTEDVDVAYADTPDEYVAKARYYLDHPDEARRMGRNALKAMERGAGWEVWWDSVAEKLAAKGIRLDLQGAAVTPDPAEFTVLTMATTALAHASEREGKTVQAAIYFNEVLTYDPTDYSANAGLARLAETGAEARRYWQAAGAHVGTTICVKLPHRLNWPGIGDEGTNFAVEAAMGLARSARQDGDWEALMQVMPTLCRFDAYVGPATVAWLLERGHIDLAVRVADLNLSLWPDIVAAWRLRGDLNFDQGRYAEALADHEQADRMKGGLLAPK
jgi:tetratricopeptide (TPR) repeat protein